MVRLEGRGKHKMREGEAQEKGCGLEATFSEDSTSSELEAGE